jgi:hypothetical protein
MHGRGLKKRTLWTVTLICFILSKNTRMPPGPSPGKGILSTKFSLWPLEFKIKMGASKKDLHLPETLK